MKDRMKNIILGFVFLFIIAICLYMINIGNIELFKNTKPVVFLHIPKNAGTKIKQMYPKFKNKPHWDSYPKQNEINIAVIRNPTTRLQSIFSHIKYRQEVEKNAYDLFDFETLHDLATAYYNKNAKNHTKAVDIFKWDDTSIKKYKSSPECTNSTPCIHWLPQHLYINGNQPAIVDYFMRFEYLDEDISKLQQQGILESHKITNSKSRQTPNKYKNLAEITPICNKLVNDIYKKDLILWEQVNNSI
jgi:hypothetical protein